MGAASEGREIRFRSREWCISAGIEKACAAPLQDGKWNGEQVLPPGWVQYSTTPTSAFRGYGAGWWLQFPGKEI